MHTLTDIANEAGTDKGTLVGCANSYSPIYDFLWSSRREEPLKILEIGLCVGGPEVEDGSADRDVTRIPSVRMWHEYFPNADIYGADISDFSKFENDWFKFVRVDCGDARQLSQIARIGIEFDIIVDDGSHASFHQQLTLSHLLPLVKPGGMYVIEDLGWQPKEYTASLPPVAKTDLLLRRWMTSGEVLSSPASNVFDQIESVLLFSHRTLQQLGDQYNRQNGVDVPPNDHRPGIVRSLRNAVSAARSKFTGQPFEDATDHVQLAIIRKKGR